MNVYLRVLKLSIQDFFMYRVDFILQTVKYAGMVLLMTFVWLAVERTEPSNAFSPQETMSYFVFSALIYSLSNMHTWYIEDDIRLGSLVKYLTKPVNPLTYYYFFQSAEALLATGIKFIVLIPILLWSGWWHPASWLQMLIFLGYIPLVYSFTFIFFSTISTLAFWMSDVFSLRWALTTIQRLLAGTLIPIAFFPTAYQQISVYLPFQYLAYTPIRVLQNAVSLHEAVVGLGVLSGWLLIMALIRHALWNHGVKQFEGTGI